MGELSPPDSRRSASLSPEANISIGQYLGIISGIIWTDRDIGISTFTQPTPLDSLDSVFSLNVAAFSYHVILYNL